MKFVALISGGKDSVYSILACIRQGHVLVACVHLGRPSTPSRESDDGARSGREEDEDAEESYMYQTAGSETLRTIVEECIGVPFIEYTRQGLSVNTSLVYQPTEKDEVEDLYQALVKAQQQLEVFEGVSSGAILSTYQRVRVENVCSRLGLTSLSYLWRRGSQQELLGRMIDECGIVAVLVRVAAPPGLVPRRHLNQTIQQLYPHFHQLYQKYQFHMCGEGGEYESLVLDCPLYKKRLVLDRVEILESGDDGVGVLRIHACHAEPKEDAGNNLLSSMNPDSNPRSNNTPQSSKHEDSFTVLGTGSKLSPEDTSLPQTSLNFVHLPRVRRVAGGLLHVGEIVAAPLRGSDKETEAELAVEEALQVFHLLRLVLKQHGCTPQDVFLVHLYLAQISHFAVINQHYREFFGVMLPPSRTCVGLHGLNHRRVQLDCIVQCGSGDYLRENNSSNNPYTKASLTSTRRLREVLHVQSMSFWAPICVGPYSQVNKVHGLLWVAGQIGLNPPTMKLQPGWSHQLQQAWTNLANILDALQASLANIMLGMVYVTTSVFLERGSLLKLQSICQHQRAINGGVICGAIDGIRSDHDGYEDEETRQELSRNSPMAATIPLLVVAVSELPVGAEVELEVVAASLEASSTLEFCKVAVQDHVSLDNMRMDGWSTGHDFDIPVVAPSIYEIDAQLYSLGSGAISYGLVTAYTDDRGCVLVDCERILSHMMRCLSKACAESSVHVPSILHLRLFYVCVGDNGSVLDSSIIRCAFHASLAVFGSENLPATSTVPVEGINLVQEETALSRSFVFAIQVLMLDPVRADTDLWIHHGRRS